MIAPCTHVRVHHQHGTDARYRADGCRCTPCITAHTRYEKGQQLRRARGWRATVPAGPIRRHIIDLLITGMSHRGIARQAGVALLTVRNIADDNQATVRIATATAILGLKPAILDGAHVPALGATRRLRALTTLGWSAPALSTRLGLHADTVTRITTGTPQITHANDQAIRVLYRELCIKPATGNPSALARTRAWAARQGWVGPMAWEDIDNDEYPLDLEPYEDGRVIDTIRDLEGQGLTRAAIAARLGVKDKTVATHIQRATRKAAA